MSPWLVVEEKPLDPLGIRYRSLGLSGSEWWSWLNYLDSELLFFSKMLVFGHLIH